MKVYLVIAHDNEYGGEEETYIAKFENEQEEDKYFDCLYKPTDWVADELAQYGLTDNDIHFYAMSGDDFHDGVMKMGDFDYIFMGEMEK